MGTEETTAKQRAQPTTGERQRASTRPTTGRLVVPSEANAQPPATAAGQTQRLRAELYRPQGRPAPRTPQAQRQELRRFAYGGPVAFFHTIADYIDMVIRPTFAAITYFVNFLLHWAWYLVERLSGTIGGGTRSPRQRSAPPTLQPGSPAATLVSVLVIVFVVTSLARPIIWPAQPEPRAFGATGGNPSNPLKARNFFQDALTTLAGAITGAQQAPPAAPEAPLAVRDAGDHDLRGAPTISAAHIDQILASYNSPATGSGDAWVAMGEKYGIDPAYAVAFFIHESSAGTNPGWAGIKSDGSTTHNIGNIICAGYSACYGRFRDYPSWEAGIDDWYKLISVEYINGRGTTTVADILPIYAPASENDTEGYIHIVEQMVDGWRSGKT